MAEKVNTIKVKFLAKTAAYDKSILRYKPVPIHSYYLYLFWKTGDEYKLFLQTDDDGKKLKDQGKYIPVIGKPDAQNPEFCDYPLVRKATYYGYFSGKELTLEELQNIADERNHLLIKMVPNRHKFVFDDSLFYWISVIQKIEKDQLGKLETLKYIYELYSNTKTPVNNEEEWLVKNPHIVLPDGQPCHIQGIAMSTYLYVKDNVNNWKSRITDVSNATVAKLQNREGVPMGPLHGTDSLWKHIYGIEDYSTKVHSYVLNSTEETKLNDNTIKMADVFEEHFNTPHISMKTGHDFMDLVSGVENGFSPVSDNQINFLQCKSDLHNIVKPLQVSTTGANFTKDIILNNNVDRIAKTVQKMTGAHIPVNNIINKFGVVWLKKEHVSTAALTDSNYYLFLYDKPEKRPAGKILKQLQLNTRLFVKSIPSPGWHHVTTDENLSGYVEARYVNLRMPDYNSIIYKIKADDTGSSIINKFMKTGDRKLYLAHVLLFINNPDNNKPGAGIRVNEDGFDLWRDTGLSDYQNIEVFANRWIWLPSCELINGLHGIVKTGSVSEDIRNLLRPLEEPVTKFIDKWMPVGVGAALDLSAGVGFGIPYVKSKDVSGKAEVYAEGSFDTYIYRKNEDVITIVRTGSLEVGVEALAVATRKIGPFEVSKRNANSIQGCAALSLNASASININMSWEYDFYFKEDMATLGLIYIAVSPYLASASLVLGPASIIGYILLNLLAGYILEPEQYLNKIKMFVEAEAEASVNAYANLSIQTNVPPKKISPSASKGKVALSSNSLTKMIPNLSTNLFADASFLAGVEIDRSEKEFSKYFHADGQVELQTSILCYSHFLNKELGMGFKITERELT